MKKDSIRFGEASDAYQRGRPSYPAEAVEWMLGSAPIEVLDLGAGTGKLTGSVVGQGHTVLAVDPDAAMLSALAQTLPTVETRVGTAEQIPLADASVDAVVLGQGSTSMRPRARWRGY